MSRFNLLMGLFLIVTGCTREGAVKNEEPWMPLSPLDFPVASNSTSLSNVGYSAMQLGTSPFQTLGVEREGLLYFSLVGISGDRVCYNAVRFPSPQNITSDSILRSTLARWPEVSIVETKYDTSLAGGRYLKRALVHDQSSPRIWRMDQTGDGLTAYYYVNECD